MINSEATSIIIVAHLDDEILFFNSMISEQTKIVVVFSQSSNEIVSSGRVKIQKKLPYSNIEFLNFTEADVYDAANFEQIQSTEQGLKVDLNSMRYERNFEKLRQYVKRSIKPGDVVYTHNPWGEYGHEEHVQVFNAVYAEINIGFDMYVSGYYSNKSTNLMRHTIHKLSGKFEIKKTDPVFGAKLMDLFKLYNCWTAPEDWQWPEVEIFHQVNKISQNQNNTSTPLLIYLTQNFKTSKHHLLKRRLINLLPKALKKNIKFLVSKFKR